MEDLFSTSLAVNDHTISYRVFFDQEQYHFRAEESKGEQAFSEFSFRREHDEWHEQELLPADLRKQAIQALERYLLRQH